MINKKSAFYIFIIAFTVIIFGALSPTHAQSTYIQHYTTKDGLPSNICFYTLQDTKGYIWIGTDAGVSRFDGRRFENFTIDDGLPDNQILQIKEDKKGRIWFIAFNGEMSYFLDGKIYNSENDKTLKLLKFNAIVISVFQDSKNRMWFGTNKNILFMFDGQSLTSFTTSDTENQFLFTYVNEDDKGRIWTYSKESIRIYEHGIFKLTAHVPIQPVSYKTMMIQKNNTLLFIDKFGLNYRKGKEAKLLKNINPEWLNFDLGFFYADNKDLWLSNQHGVYHLDDQQKVTTYLKGVPTSQVIRDAENNMWFTTSDGIYKLPSKENRLYTFNKSQGLSSNIIKSVTKDKKNNLWLGMDGGYLNRIHPKTQKVDKIDIPDKKNYGAGIKKLLLDTTNQSLYFASEYGLGVLQNIDKSENSINYLKENNQSFFVVKDFSINKEGQLALALSSGVAILKNRTKNLKFSMQELENDINFFDDRSYCVFYDQKSNLWFSNIHGLSQFNKGRLISYVKNALLNTRINDIKQLADGTIILATDGYGAIFIKGDKILYRITQQQGLASNICKKIFISNNHIWLITNKGINRICMDLNFPTVESFEYTNALLLNDVNDLYIDADTAYFATNSGLVYFHNKPIHKLVNAPSPLISSILVNGDKRSLKDPNIILKPTSNKIAFYFSAIDFQGKDIWYRYRIRQGDQWTETKNRRIEVSSLEPGKYKFELCAQTNNSNWSKPVAINFELKAQFWQTTWFLLLLFAIAAFTLYRIAVVVTKKQKNKEQQKLLLKNKILMLEQGALQAMMNPHFVFNVMNSIQHYINTKDTSSANKVLTGFAKLIRKNMEICTKTYISLEEEIEYLELYLSLEKKRFGHKLRYQIQVDPKLDKEETIIPSMLLQPYIENAIWHGIMPMEEGGDLKIAISQQQEDCLLIEISDNGIGIDNSLKHKKIGHTSKGMNLTQERINLLNQIEANPIQITVQQNGISGTKVLILVRLN